jgi:segregation and condensation protein A
MENDSVTGVLAVVAGHPLTEFPNDLFIPPDALEVLLDSFSGPLDLLLYLIRQQDIDIMNIPMAMITQQYMQYIDLLEVSRMELAADYLVMAALLIEIKSKLLLPSQLLQEDESEEDPRMELVRRLQTYEYFKQLALLMDQLPRFEREVFQVKIKMGDIIETKIYPQVALSSIVLAMERLLQHQQCINPHQVTREPLSVRERMDLILGYFEHHSLIEFTRLLIPEEGRMGLVVTLLAILELARQSLVIITQTEPFSVIHLQANPHG